MHFYNKYNARLVLDHHLMSNLKYAHLLLNYTIFCKYSLFKIDVDKSVNKYINTDHCVDQHKFI